MIKVYIAGKITGDPNYKAKFAEAAKAIVARGDIPLNPAELPAGMDPADYMRICFAMIDTADIVFFLPDWHDSQGAQLEMDYCRYIGKLAFVFGEGGKNTKREALNSAPAKARRTLRDFLEEAENT